MSSPKRKFTFLLFVILGVIILSIIIRFYSRWVTGMTVLFSFSALIFGILDYIFQDRTLKALATLSIILAFMGLVSLG